METDFASCNYTVTECEDCAKTTLCACVCLHACAFEDTKLLSIYMYTSYLVLCIILLMHGNKYYTCARTHAHTHTHTVNTITTSVSDQYTLYVTL